RASDLLGGGDLHQQVRPVDRLPQVGGLGDGLVGVAGQAGVDLDRHAPVDAAGGLVDVAEQVRGVAHVGRGQLPHGGVDVGAAGGQLADLLVVGLAVGECVGEDRRVGRDADDVLVADQLGQVAGVEPLTGQVVEPDRHAGLGECCEVVTHEAFPQSGQEFLSSARRAAATTASVVNPNSRNNVL